MSDSEIEDGSSKSVSTLLLEEELRTGVHGTGEVLQQQKAVSRSGTVLFHDERCVDDG